MAAGALLALARLSRCIVAILKRGKLERLKTAGSDKATTALVEAVENLLVAGRSGNAAIKLDLRDLSRSAAAVMLDQVIDAVTQHPGWDGCGDGPALGHVCPGRRLSLIIGAFIASAAAALGGRQRDEEESYPSDANFDGPAIKPAHSTSTQSPLLPGPPLIVCRNRRKLPCLSATRHHPPTGGSILSRMRRRRRSLHLAVPLPGNELGIGSEASRSLSVEVTQRDIRRVGPN